MALSIDEPIDSGSVDVASSTVDDGASLITIQPRLSWFNSTAERAIWWWFYFTISGATGRQPTIDLLDANSTDHFNGTPDNLCRQACWAYDLNGPWYDFSSVTYPTSPDRIRLAHNEAFTEDVVHVAHYPVYTWARAEAAVATWALSPYVSNTTSSNSSLVIFQQPSRVSGSRAGNRTCPAANLYGFEITDTSVVASKNRIVVVGGNHPAEPNGSWAIEAFVDLLLSSDPRADFLRQKCVFYIYPFVNPQGRYAGMYRDAPDSIGSDHNRIWNTTGTSECIDQIKAAIVADTGGSVHGFIDMHCHNHDYGDDTNRRDLAIGTDSEYEHEAFQRLIRSYDGAWKFRTRSGLTLTGASALWVESTLDVSNSLKVSFFTENGSAATYGWDDYKLYGKRLVYTLADCVERGVFPVSGTDTSGRVYFS